MVTAEIATIIQWKPMRLNGLSPDGRLALIIGCLVKRIIVSMKAIKKY
jgi:hypothetical protein